MSNLQRYVNVEEIDTFEWGLCYKPAGERCPRGPECRGYAALLERFQTFVRHRWPDLQPPQWLVTVTRDDLPPVAFDFATATGSLLARTVFDNFDQTHAHLEFVARFHDVHNYIHLRLTLYVTNWTIPEI
jgi:hypothetical protein